MPVGGLSQGVGGWALRGGPVDDADLDDPFRAGPLEQAGHLWASHAELLRDRVLRLAQFVIEAAGADELLEVAQWARRG